VLEGEAIVPSSIGPLRRARVSTAAALAGLCLACAPAAPAPGPPSATPAAPTVAAPTPARTCPVGWGSERKSLPAMGTAPLRVVRAGTFECADRVEFEFDGPAAGYSVRYVDTVIQDGSGAELAVPGGARLQLQLHHPAYDDQGRPTFFRRVGEAAAAVRGYLTLTSAVFGGSFEGYTTIGIGVRARLPFRVWVEDGVRIVVEVAHRWS
jgi:hypothetical protein